MISRRQPHQQPLPAAVTGRDPALTERRTLLKAIIFGAGSLAVGCGSDKPRGGTAGGFELDRTDDVKSPEQIQAEAIRARDINLRAVRHIVSGLQAKCSTEFRFDPTGNRGIFTDADARSNDNLRGPEQTLDYDHDTRQLTATPLALPFTLIT